MSFAKWKKTSKHYFWAQEAHLLAAYKAGVYQGTKDTEEIATMAIKLREAVDQARCAEEMKKFTQDSHTVNSC